MTHVPYKGPAPAMTDVMPATSRPMFEFRAICAAADPLRIGAAARHQFDPAGCRSSGRADHRRERLPDYLVSVWFGVAVPANVAGGLSEESDG